jgi:membrane-bound metal-dependent hydrolase YbcI (DUF457 family)
MPNRDAHGPVGALSGTTFAYSAWKQPRPYLIAAAAGGLLGGVVGGLAPDWIDVPTSPRHRAEAHSLSITDTAGYLITEQLAAWQEGLRANAQRYGELRVALPDPLPRIGYGILELLFLLLSGFLAGVVGGYASHLVLDSLTPSSLPILC